MSWTWRFERTDGTAFEPHGAPGEGFPSQADAESWLGEEWRRLLAEGVDQVTLLEGGTPVYAGMSLHPPE